MEKISVLFVCLGNICRSPVAHGVFRELVKERGLEDKITVDSCGTGGWHIGEQAHPVTRKTALKYGLSLESHRARQFTDADVHIFDVIVAMDSSNYADLEEMGAARFSRLVRLREFEPVKTKDLDVPDPFFGTGDGFPIVHEMIERCCRNLLDQLVVELGGK